MAKLAHSMIRVLDEAASVKFYEDVFGLKIADRLDFDSFTLIYLRDAAGDFELELTVNKDRDTPYNLGDGYGHLAFVVEDLEAAVEAEQGGEEGSVGEAQRRVALVDQELSSCRDVRADRSQEGELAGGLVEGGPDAGEERAD